MNPTSTVMTDIQSSGWDLAWVVLLGLGLAAAIRGLRFGIDLAPLSERRREALRRAFPLIAGGVGVLYLLFSAGILLERYPAHFPIAVAVILLSALAASWFAVRDVVGGVFLKAGRVCRVGDYVRLGDISGRVQRMGVRSLVIETARGEEAIVPYGRVASQAVLRTPVSERGTLHVFELNLPGEASVAQTKHRIRKSALSCHWSAIAREPEISVLEADRFEVTVFGIDPDHVREVEAAVRRGVGAAKAPRTRTEAAGDARPKTTDV